MNAPRTALLPNNPASDASRDAYSNALFTKVFYNHKTFPQKRLSNLWRAIVGPMEEFNDVVLTKSAASKFLCQYPLWLRTT